MPSVFALVTIFLALLGPGWCVKEPTCVTIETYRVCHYKGVLVEVTGTGDRLDIDDLDLLAIRQDAFKNVPLKKLGFNQGNKISVLKRESFRGLDQLDRLDLDSNVVSLSEELFAELGRLEALSLMFCKINYIPDRSFAGLSNLMFLYLSANDIPTIGTNSFAGISTKLGYLWLNNNNISVIEPGAFIDLRWLDLLQLENNQLTDLHPETFDGLDRLSTLNLNNNRLTTLRRNAFKGTPRLEKLSLEANDISLIEEGAFAGLSRLRELLLFQNKLTTISVPTFQGLGKLRVLDLSLMPITEVQPNSFSSLAHLEELRFMGNDKIQLDCTSAGLDSSVKCLTQSSVSNSS